MVSPNPAYPIHQYGVIMAEGHACMLPMPDAATFLDRLRGSVPRIAQAAEDDSDFVPAQSDHHVRGSGFLQGDRAAGARITARMIVHDFAYADLGFDGYKPPSILQVRGRQGIAVEIFSMSKSYNMAGWRVGFCLGNPKMIAALARIKSYLDYGVFQPIQIASIIGMEWNE